MLRKAWFYGFVAATFFISACGGAKGNQNPNSEAEANLTAEPANTTGSSDSSGATDPDVGTSSPGPTTEGVSAPPPTDQGGAPSPQAGWHSLGNQVNPGGEANVLSMKTVGGVPYVSWEEKGKIYVAAWDGGVWKVEGPLNVDPQAVASLPTLAADSDTLYLSWTEERSVYIQKRENGKWTPVAVQSALGEDCFPANADLTVRRGVPTLAFDAFCPDTQYASTLVQQWVGSWTAPEEVGARAHYADTPFPRKYALAEREEGSYLAVVEGGSTEGRELRLYHKTSGGWAPVGGAINDPLSVFIPPFGLAFFEDAPHLIFKGDGIRVAHWNGTSWVATGAALSADGIDPALAGTAQHLYAGFGGSSVEVRRWDGSAWTPEGSPLNQPGSYSWSVALSATDQNLYTAWIEDGSIFVKEVSIQ
jgi:hypothetical protein